jgi:hypothetical protein
MAFFLDYFLFILLVDDKKSGKAKKGGAMQTISSGHRVIN